MKLILAIDRKSKGYRIICPSCNGERFVFYTQNWNIEKGTSSGRCQKCNIKRNIKGLEKGRLWNKGKNFSGMSGRKQSEYQKSILRERNLNDNPSKKPEVRKKMRLAKLGKRNHLTNNWKGGKNSGREGRGRQEYKEWRMAIYKRDGFACVVCGNVGRNLNAHHIKEWVNFPELRLDIKNGVTMCEGCHKLYHKNKRKNK